MRRSQRRDVKSNEEKLRSNEEKIWEVRRKAIGSHEEEP
jgi:hypothetical protein